MKSTNTSASVQQGTVANILDIATSHPTTTMKQYPKASLPGLPFEIIAEIIKYLGATAPVAVVSLSLVSKYFHTTVPLSLNVSLKSIIPNDCSVCEAKKHLVLDRLPSLRRFRGDEQEEGDYDALISLIHIVRDTWLQNHVHDNARELWILLTRSTRPMTVVRKEEMMMLKRCTYKAEGTIHDYGLVDGSGEGGFAEEWAEIEQRLLEELEGMENV